MNQSLARVCVGVIVMSGLLGCASTPHGAASDPVGAAALTIEERRELVMACTDLVLDYALYRDQLDIEKTAALFSRDARLSVQGQTFFGREAIRERMRDAQKGPKTRHLMSTIRITPVDVNRATGISYVTVYASTGAGKEGEVQQVDGFAIIGNYVDEFVRTESGWRIANRHLEGAFQQRGP